MISSFDWSISGILRLYKDQLTTNNPIIPSLGRSPGGRHKNKYNNSETCCLGLVFQPCFFEFFYKVRGASSDPCSEAFHGEESLSEKEVQSVARFLETQKKRLVGYLDIHSYGQMLLFPWGYTQEQSKDHIEMVRNIKTVADPGEGPRGSDPPVNPPSPPYLKFWIRHWKILN